MDIVVKGRNVEVPDHYREHVADKLSKVERYDQKLMRADVELFHERNPRQSDTCQRVEITVMTKGPVIRAEAQAQDFYAALDCAIIKLDARLRRSADRRRVHRGRHAPVSVAAATANLPTDLTSRTATLTAVGKVVLAAAHLDHDPAHCGPRHRNVKALCQRCHLLHDRPEHRRRIRLTLRRRRALGDLFSGPYPSR